MPAIDISVSGTSYTHEATTAEAQGLASARALVMRHLPPGPEQTAETPAEERPGYVLTDALYLQGVVANHCAQTNESPADVMARCLASWAAAEWPTS